MNTAALLAGIKRLCAPYSAPYFEGGVRTALRQWLTELHLESTLDAYGNTWVRLQRGKPAHPIALVAHLDHPALQVHSTRGRTVICTALGGLPTVGLKHTPVCFPYTAAGSVLGEISSAQVHRGPPRPRLERCTVRLPRDAPTPQAGDVGIFNLPALARRGHRLLARSADDLMGCAAIVAALHDLHQQGLTPPRSARPPHTGFDVTALFTRAEEVGLHGAMAIAHDGLLPAHTLVVSVECSQAYDSFVLGKGPVVRTGDRAGPFSPAACALARAAAHSVEALRFQIGAMTGGTCEAAAFLAFGYNCTGVSLPLANYHNQGSHGVVPEEIDLRDLQGARQLLAALCLRAGSGEDDVKSLRNDLILSSDGGRRRLQQGINHDG